MLVQQNFLVKLRDFGLNIYESKLWTALLSRGTSTAGELSDIAVVPRSRTYDVLETLEKKGFILKKSGKPIKYVAIEPEKVLDRIKGRVQIEADSHLKLMEEFKSSDLLNELNLLHAKGNEIIEPTELTGSITGRENLYQHIDSRLAKATQIVSILTSFEGLVRIHNYFNHILKKLKSKGVEIRIAVYGLKEAPAIVNEVSKYANVRLSEVSGRFFVIDGQEIVLMLFDDKLVHPSYDMGVWINTRFFAQMFEKAFYTKWQQNKPI